NEGADLVYHYTSGPYHVAHGSTYFGRKLLLRFHYKLLQLSTLIMSNSKALILGILLLVPLLIFIFIGSFGEHHYTLRTYFPQVTATGDVVRDAQGDTL